MNSTEGDTNGIREIKGARFKKRNLMITIKFRCGEKNDIIQLVAIDMPAKSRSKGNRNLPNAEHSRDGVARHGVVVEKK